MLIYHTLKTFNKKDKMAQLKPFRGILYNPFRVTGDLVTAPPYDIISLSYKEHLYNKSEFNIIRIDFGVELPGDTKAFNQYTRAKADFEKWLNNEILIRDKSPCLYAYEINYHVHGSNLTLRGLVALVKIEELGRGIYPHEATYSKPKADRLNLMRACNANISPIYALYNSPEKVTSHILASNCNAPWLTSKDADGAVHKIYKIEDPKIHEQIISEFWDKSIYIADGHHRYEVALEFKKEMDLNTNAAKLSYDYVMMFLANIQDKGITVLPTHRLIKYSSDSKDILKKLENYFDISSADSQKDIMDILISESRNAIGLYMNKDNRWYILKHMGERLRDIHPSLSNLDVVLLHELIFKKILGIREFAYEMNPEKAIRMVQSRDFDAAFFLKPTSLKDVEQVALANERMPPKSTYFYPKLLTGMVINSFM